MNNLPRLKGFRRRLRQQLTPAEAKLWTCLKNRQLDGRRFRRQHSIAGYVLDFYCPAERLAVELDGESHNSPMAGLYDLERTRFLASFGIRELRFENRMVFESTDWVLDEIRASFGRGKRGQG